MHTQPLTQQTTSYNPITGNASITDTLISRYQHFSTTSTSNKQLEDDHTKACRNGDGCSGGVYGYFKNIFSNSAYLIGQGKYPSPSDFTERERIENFLMQKRTATSYQGWLNASENLDNLQKFTNWKDEDESTLYDFKLIKKNLSDLKEARESGNTRKLLYLIRTTWTRNIGNMGNVNLYRHTHTGTKSLITEYMKECQLALDLLTQTQTEGLDDKYILGMLVQTRKNIGRTALVLSGGGCFGLFHIGVLAALLEESLLPRIISGSSAGAIVASVLCVHNADEISGILTTIVEKQFNIFDTPDNKETWLSCLSRFLKYGTWYDNKNLQTTMIEFLGDLTFREAFNRTGRILNITVSPASEHEQARLLNYLTAPSVLIWSAVCASCSLPGVFPSTAIYEKNMKTGETQEWHHTSVKFLDGSVDNDLPITRLSEMFNVDHIIACQVNPHVVPFLKLSVSCVGGEIETEYSAKFKTRLGQCYQLLASEVSHYLQMSEEVGVARNISSKLRSIISQQYSGDITILPDLDEVFRLNKLLSNPSPEYLLQSTINGARATWPKIAIIRNHCGLEFALDEAIKQLRIRNFKNFNINYGIPLVNSPMMNSPSFISEDHDVASNEEVSLDNDTAITAAATSLSQPSSAVKKLLPQPSIPTTVPSTTAMARNHTRHRSESLSIARLRSLRQNSSSSQTSLASQRKPSMEHIITTNFYPGADSSTSPITPQTAPAQPRMLRNKSEIYFPKSIEQNQYLVSPIRKKVHTSISNSNIRRAYQERPRKNSTPGELSRRVSLDRLRESTASARKSSRSGSSSGFAGSASLFTKATTTPNTKMYANIDHHDGLFVQDNHIKEHDDNGFEVDEDAIGYEDDEEDNDGNEDDEDESLDDVKVDEQLSQ